MKKQEMRVRTKIVCTIGPSVSEYKNILQLIDAGMNVARINMSHGTQDTHLQTIEKLKKARAERGIPLAIMLDTKGPEIRIGELKEGKISLEAGQKLPLLKKQIQGDEKGISINPPDILEDVDIDSTILFDDGYITSKVIEKHKEKILIEIQNSGILKSRKGVNIPHVHLKLSAVTEQDTSDIIFGCRNGIDLIAASFIRSSEHVVEIRELLTKQKAQHILIISKIESALGVKNFDSILNVSDGIMVARGDLGVELPLTQVPKLQKEIIRKSYQAFKPVITATQMLESMMENPRPTRAEISDVANAVYDSSSAVMLSGETAAGKYPIEAVRIMRSTIEEAEKDFHYIDFFYHDAAQRDFHDISTCVALAAVKTAYTANGKSLIASTSSGFTARMMERFRPEMPIIAITSNEKTYHQLALSWGVIPIHAKVSNLHEAISKASCFALQNKLLHYGDLIVTTSGTPFGVTGTTNMMVVDNIGEVLIRGAPCKGKRIYGKVAFFLSKEEPPPSFKEKIIIVNQLNEEDEKKFKDALGIILQNNPDDTVSEEIAKHIAASYQIPLLLRADGASSILKEDQEITLEPSRGLVFNGIIQSEEELIPKICEI